MHAMEAEEVFFKDIITLPIEEHGFGAAHVCPVFREVCEPNSLFVQFAFVPDCSSHVGSRVVSAAGRQWVECRLSPAPRRKLYATLTVAGVRKGFSGVKLPRYSAEDMMKNRRFYAAAYQPDELRQ